MSWISKEMFPEQWAQCSCHENTIFVLKSYLWRGGPLPLCLLKAPFSFFADRYGASFLALLEFFPGLASVFSFLEFWYFIISFKSRTFSCQSDTQYGSPSDESVDKKWPIFWFGIEAKAAYQNINFLNNLFYLLHSIEHFLLDLSASCDICTGRKRNMSTALEHCGN